MSWPSFSLQDLTAPALVSLAVLSIYRGWLVPSWFYRELKERAEVERQAKEDALEANKILLEQNTLLLKKDDAAHQALYAIREKANET